ncbi:putative immunity protein [Nonomuraea wenchangensis]
MADDFTTIELSLSELREVAGYAVACARPALAIFERERPAASDAGRAALAAAGAGYLHPLAKATQVKHILGPAAHSARAFELSAGDDPSVGADHIAQSRALAGPVVVAVLRRYPPAPSGGGRVGELLRQLDVSLR